MEGKHKSPEEKVDETLEAQEVPPEDVEPEEKEQLAQDIAGEASEEPDQNILP